MNIFHLTNNESFSVGINVPADFPANHFEKTENFIIFLINEGSASIEIDFCQYELQKNRFIIIGKDLFFKCTDISDDFRVSHITFSVDIWLEITDQFDYKFFSFLKKYPYSPTMSEEQVVKFNHMIHAINGVYQEHENIFRQKMFKNFLQNFLLNLYDKTKARFLNHDANNTCRQEELFEKFIALVFKHSSTNRDVKFYADKMCISTRYLSSLVQNMTGQTPKVIISHRCIQEIKRMLRTTNDSIQEIAFQLHFPDQSFFSRYFKKHTGMSPMDYRNKQE